MEPNEQAIREVDAAWIEAVNAGDLDRLLGMMAEGVVFLNPGQEPMGREGFGPGFLGAHREARIVCLSELDEVVVVGDLAYARSRDSLAVTPRAGGDTERLAGHRLTVYRRRPDGRWLLACAAHTLAPGEGDPAHEP
jgi:uncharacterized protein (TIGR02246 family)